MTKIKLTESELTKLITRIVSEQSTPSAGGANRPIPRTGGGVQSTTRPKPSVSTNKPVNTISSNSGNSYMKLRICNPGDQGRLVKNGTVYALSSGSPFCRIGTN